jgi:hypothetical protein
MMGLKVSVITTIALLFAGCGGTPQCREPQPYEQARLGQPIEVPEDLDPLDPGREMTIPEPSPRPPRGTDAPCLEYPPTLTGGEAEPEPAAEPATEAEAEQEQEPEQEPETPEPPR